MHHRSLSFPLSLVLALACGCRIPSKPVAPPPPPITCAPLYAFTPEDEQLLDDLQRRIFDYFWNEVYPETGIAIDHTENRIGKVAATGFELAAICIGVERGWITRDQGLERTLLILNAFWDDPGDPNDAFADGEFGLFWHYVDGKTGRMKPIDCVAPCDSADFIAGVIVAGEYFKGTPAEALAKTIYDNVQWDKFVAKNADGSPDLMSFGWVPLHVSESYFETDGLLDFNMSGFADNSLLIYALALGSDTHPIPQETWEQYVNSYTLAEYEGHECVYAGSIFCRTVPQSFIRFSRKRDRKIDYFLDTANAYLADRAFNMKENGYPPELWGLTDCFGKDSYGHSAPPGPIMNDGTVGATAFVGALPHVPRLSLDAMRYVRKQWGDRAYGKYGFTSSMNLLNSFVSPLYVGIELGPMIMMAENARSGLIWDLYSRSPAMSNFVRRAKMSGVIDDFELPPEAPQYGAWTVEGGQAAIGQDAPQHGKKCLEVTSASNTVRVIGQLTVNDLLDFPFGRYVSFWTRDLAPLSFELVVDGKTVPLAAAGDAQGRGWTHHLFKAPDTLRSGSLCGIRIDAAITGPRPALDNISLEAVADVMAPYTIQDLRARKGKAGGTVDLTWTAPADPEGDPVVKYILTASATPDPGRGEVIELLPIRRAGETETQTVLLESGKSYYLSLAAMDAYGHCAPASALVQVTANRGPVNRSAYGFEDGGFGGWENGNTNWVLQVTDSPRGDKCLRVDYTKTHGWNFITLKVDPAMLAVHRFITLKVKGRVTLLGKLWCSDELQQDLDHATSPSETEWTTLKFDTRRADRIIPGRDHVEKLLLFVEPGVWSGSGAFYIDDVEYSGK
jgi:hypothetical protein